MALRSNSSLFQPAPPYYRRRGLGDSLLGTVGDSVDLGSLDGDQLELDFTPGNYVPSTTPPEADALDQLTAHLAGIDSALGGAVVGAVPSVVADITARDALTPATGELSYVVDASADGTVTAGAAFYIWDGAAWQKFAEDESLDLSGVSPAVAVSPAATDQVGAVGTSSLFAREDHAHPAQSAAVTLIADAGALITGVNVEDALQEGAGEWTTLRTLSGTAAGATDLGDLAGSTVTTGADIRTALEELEAAHEGHAARHIQGGADEIDGDQIDIDLTPVNYTPSTLPAEVTDADHLSAHLAGIDLALAASNVLTVVANIAARDALTPASGDRAYVTDASADTAVDSGAAFYLYDGAAWLKVSEAESMDHAAIAISPEATDQTGAVGTSLLFSREDHAHPAQAASVTDIADAGALITATEVEGALQEGAGEWTTLRALSGTSAGDAVLGAFSGSTITTGGTITAALQELETALEANPQDRLFADDTTVAPASAGAPTEAEIATFAGANTDTVIYYTGDDTSTNPPTHVYHIDASGNVTTLLAPSAATPGIDDVLAEAQALTASRTILAGSNPFIIEAGSSVNRTTYFGGDLSVTGGLSTGLDDRQTGTIAIEGFVDFTAAEPALVAGNAYVNTTTGTSSGTAFAVVAETVYQVTSTGAGFLGFTPQEGWKVFDRSADSTFYFDGAAWAAEGGASSNNRLFADDTTVAPATAGQPTIAEITTFAGANTDTVIYYTGDDTSTNAPTHVFHIDGSGNVTLLNSGSLYDADGTLSGNRSVTLDGNTLTFDGDTANVSINNNGRVFLRSIERNVDSVTAATATDVTPDFALYESFSLVFTNASTGDINVLTPAIVTSAAQYGPFRVSVGNSDAIARNAVFSADYKAQDGSDLGTVALAAGEQRSIWFKPDSAAGTLIAFADSAASSASGSVYADFGNAFNSVFIQNMPSGQSVGAFLVADVDNKLITRVETGSTVTLADVQTNVPSVTSFTSYDTGGTSEGILTTGTDVIPAGSYVLNISLAGNIQAYRIMEETLPPVLEDWAASTAYVEGQLVRQGDLTLRRVADGTSAATYTNVEAATWTVIAQNNYVDWSTATTGTYTTGEIVVYEGRLYRCHTSFTDDGTFDIGNFALLFDGEAISDWQPDTRYEVGDVVTYQELLLRRTSSAVPSNPTFTVQEANLWDIVTPVELLARLAGGLHESAATGTGAIIRSGLLPERDMQHASYEVTDTDAAVTSEISLDLSSLGLDFNTGDTYAVQFDLLEQDAVANQVVEVRYADTGGNSTSEFIDVGTTAALVAGGADAGNVSGSGSLQVLQRHGVNRTLRFSLILSWTGAMGPNPEIVLAPVYNLDGTAVADATTTGSLHVTNFRVGDPSELVESTAAVQATIIDSSGGAVALTLPAATGSGDIVFYTNDDVQSNAASITVQAGESLAGATDGLFLFSNYADGTQFQAVDTAAGVWHISVTGDDQQTALHYFSARGGLTDITFAGAGIRVDVDFSAFVDHDYQVVNEYDPQALRTSATELTVQNAGLYKIVMQANHPQTNQGGANNQDAFHTVIGYALNGDVAGVVIGEETDTNEVDGVIDGQQLVELSAGDVITFFLREPTSGRASEDYTMYIALEQQPAASAVLAGMVTPYTLLHAHASNGFQGSLSSGTGLQSIAVTADTADIYGTVRADVVELATPRISSGSNVTYSATGASFTEGVTSARVEAAAVLQWDVGSESRVVLQLVRNGTEILDATYQRAPSVASSEVALRAVWTGDLAAGDELSLRVGSQVSGNCDVMKWELDVVQLPTSTVVNPDALTVETLSSMQVRLSATTNDAGQPNYGFDTIVSQVAGTDPLALEASGAISGLKAGKTYRLTANMQILGLGDGNWEGRFIDLTNDATIGTPFEIVTPTFTVHAGGQGGMALFVPSTDCEVGVDYTAGSVGELSNRSVFTVEEISPRSVTVYEPDQVEAKALSRVRMTRTAAFTPTTGVSTRIEFDAVDFNVGGLGNITTGTITIAETGYYRVRTGWRNVTGANSVQAEIWVDGVVRHRGGDSKASGGGNLWATAETFVYLEANQTVEAYAFTGQASAADVSAVEDLPFLEVVQQPTTEVVTPGDVPVELLQNGVATLASNHDIAATGGSTDFEDIALQVTIPAAGRWRLEAVLHGRVGDASDDGQGIFAVITDSSNVVVNDGGTLRLVGDSDGTAVSNTVNKDLTTMGVAYVTTTGAATYKVRVAQESNVPAQFIDAGSTLRYEQLASNTVITYNPGDVEVNELDSWERALAADISNGFGSTLGVDADATILDTVIKAPTTTKILDNGDGTVTLSNGRYFLEAKILADFIGTNSVDAAYRIHDGTSAVGRIGTIQNDQQTGSARSTAAYEVTVTDAVTFSVQVTSADPGADLNEVRAGSFFRVTQMPTLEVVAPGSLTVEAHEVLEGTNTTVSAGLSTLLDGGRTWNDLATDYEYIRFEVRGEGTGGADDWYYWEERIPTARLTELVADPDGAIINFSHIAGFTLQFTILQSYLTGGDVSVGSAGWGRVECRVYGVRAQQTVINTIDAAVDDQSASGYMDIGGMRMQWGNSTSTGTTGHVVSFPAAFADTAYAVTCTPSSGGNGQTINVTAKSASDFTVTSVDVNATLQNVSFGWIAIGTTP